MGKITTILGVVPITLVTAYLLILSVNILTLFKPTLYIPFIHELRGETDASGQPLLPGNGPYLAADQQFRLALRLSKYEEPKSSDDSEQLWQSDVFLLEDTSTLFPIETELSIELPVKRKQLASDLYAHIYLYPILGNNAEEEEEEEDDEDELAMVSDAHPELETSWTVKQTIPLIQYQPLIIKEDRLLMASKESKSTPSTSKASSSSNEETSQIPVAHWVPQIEMNLLTDRTEYPRNAVPSDIHAYMSWVKRGDTFTYLPIMSSNPLLLGPEDLVPIEVNGTIATTKTLKLRVALTSLGWFRISRILWSTIQSFGGASKGSGQSTGFRLSSSEVDQFRQMITRTDPWLLLATIVASVLHLLFEWLAFKEDVAHWSKLKNTAGVSKMAVILEMISRCVAVLFLWERRKDTSMLIIGGACVTACSEIWKVYRVLNAPPATIASSTEKQKDGTPAKVEVTEAERVSREADRQCTRSIGLACIPLIVGYAAWSLFFLKHASFRAWMIDALMATMYLLGFITLTPQLFLNYRLRSVAAMPLRVFLYRALNTFVDDLFALVIPMPNLTRIAAFRDDIVFVILLWQWWRYPSRKETDKLKEE